MIPLEMTHLPSWVLWRLEEREDGKPTKMPYSPRTGHRASVTDPSHWATYGEALHVLQSGVGGYSGVGFVFSDNDPFCGIDLDDPKGDIGAIERASLVLKTFGETYSEVSPSGNGIHIIVRGSVPSGRRRDRIEVYSKERYFTMTGNSYNDAQIVECDFYLQRLWEELGGANVPAPGLIVGSAQTKTDEEVYAKACSTNEKFLPLFQGNYAQWYTSQSEADMALVNLIGFYSRNRDQIARMFLASELGKRKKAHRKDYLSKMIDKSFDNLTPDISLDALMENFAKQLAEMKEKERKDPKPVYGEGWSLPPGLVGDIAKFIYDAAPRPVQEIALAASIGLMAGICGRAYNVSNTGLNHYILLMAGTGRGKEAMKHGITALMKEVANHLPGAKDFIGPSSIASGQALTKYMGRNRCFVSILGEFGITLEQICDPRAQPAQKELRRVILDLFGKSGKSDSLSEVIYSDKANDTQVVYSPALTILGETTPDSFYPHLTEDMVASGLLPRFTCIEYKGRRVAMNKSHADAVPTEELVSTMVSLCANALTMAQHNRFIDVQIDPQGTTFLEHFSSKCDSHINGSESRVIQELWNRGHLKVMKLAGLIAVGCDIFQPIITLEIAEWAANMVERDIANILDRFESGQVGADTNEQQQIQRILGIIKDFIYRPFDASMEKYCVNDAMKRDRVVQWSYLSKRLIGQPAFKLDRMGASFALKRAMDLLAADGTIIELSAAQLSSRYQYTGKAYFVNDLAKVG